VRYASAEPRDAADPQQTSRLAAALKPARGPLDKEIAAVALPAMLSLAVFPVVGMVDTFFVGRMGSALSLAGQGAANAAFNFCFFVLAVVPTLTAPRVARAAARGDDEAVRTTARESLWIAGAVGLCGTIALVGWPRYFLKLVLPANAPALAPAARYLRYRALGYLPALLSSTCFAAFRGLLDTATPLRISLFYNALNAVLDPILIFGCGLGVAGAALATALAESVGCLMYLSQLSKRIGGRKLLPTFWRRPPARATVKALAAGAAAMQVRQIALNAAFGAATRSAQAMDATGVKAAAYSISQQLWLLAGVALFALQSSAAALVPAALGKGDKNDDADATDAARRVADRCMAVWKSNFGRPTPSTRCCFRSCVCSMAWSF
jgi:putative MATE family efflux protein